MINHASKVPNFITAQSLTGLRREMIKINASKGTMFTYFDISQFTDRGKLKWVAWYLDELNSVKELDNDNSELV